MTDKKILGNLYVRMKQIIHNLDEGRWSERRQAIRLEKYMRKQVEFIENQWQRREQKSASARARARQRKKEAMTSIF